MHKHIFEEIRYNVSIWLFLELPILPLFSLPQALENFLLLNLVIHIHMPRAVTADSQGRYIKVNSDFPHEQKVRRPRSPAPIAMKGDSEMMSEAFWLPSLHS